MMTPPDGQRFEFIRLSLEDQRSESLGIVESDLPLHLLAAAAVGDDVYIYAMTCPKSGSQGGCRGVDQEHRLLRSVDGAALEEVQGPTELFEILNSVLGVTGELVELEGRIAFVWGISAAAGAEVRVWTPLAEDLGVWDSRVLPVRIFNAHSGMPPLCSNGHHLFVIGVSEGAIEVAPGAPMSIPSMGNSRLHVFDAKLAHVSSVDLTQDVPHSAGLASVYCFDSGVRVRAGQTEFLSIADQREGRWETQSRASLAPGETSGDYSIDSSSGDLLLVRGSAEGAQLLRMAPDAEWEPVSAPGGGSAVFAVHGGRALIRDSNRTVAEIVELAAGLAGEGNH